MRYCQEHSPFSLFYRKLRKSGVGYFINNIELRKLRKRWGRTHGSDTTIDNT